jgi:hypothetical protein
MHSELAPVTVRDIDEDTFVTIRILLEECRDLNLSKETDRLVLAHQISKKMNLHMERRGGLCGTP